jgi:tetratricopeptide (TPR) repeat protein
MIRQLLPRLKLFRPLTIAGILSLLIAASASYCAFSKETSRVVVPPKPIRDKWALVIGISKFQDESINLKYAAKDAQDFHDFLVSDCNFARDHVKLLTDKDATRERILDELGDSWLPRMANPDDLVLIYISSHGSPSQIDVAGVNYIVAHNTDRDRLYATGIPIQELSRIIKQRVHSNRVVVILDACHSGAANTEGKGILRQSNFNADEVVQGTGQLVICSSSPSQTSWEGKGYSNGVFTHHLIASLRSKGKNTKLGEAFGQLKDQVQSEVLRDRGQLQTPILKSKWEGKELVLAVPPAHPTPGLHSLNSTTAEATSTRSLNTGGSTKRPTILWNTYTEQGLTALSGARYGEAEKLLQSALEQAEAAGDQRHLSMSLNNLAAVFDSEGRYGESESLYKSALAIDEKDLGKDHLDVAMSLVNLSNLYCSKGRFHDAEPLCKRSLSIIERALGPDNTDVAMALNNLASTYLAQGKFNEAQPLYERALSIYEAAENPSHIELWRGLNNLANVYNLQGKAQFSFTHVGDFPSATSQQLNFRDGGIYAKISHFVECAHFYSVYLLGLSGQCSNHQLHTSWKYRRWHFCWRSCS